MSQQVIVYGADWCIYCHKVERYLEARGVDFVVKDVDQPSNREELERKLGGPMNGIPVLDIAGELLFGSDHKKIDELLSR